MALIIGLTATNPARADGPVVVSIAATPYQLASTCSLTQPIVTVNALLKNTGNATETASVQVVDTPHVLHGETDGIVLRANREVDVSIPVSLDTRNNPISPPLGAAHIVGNHSLQIWLATTGIAAPAAQPIAVTIPASLCAAVVPSSGPFLGDRSLTARAGSPVALATATPRFGTSPTARVGAPVLLYTIAAPTALTSVQGVADCERRDTAHVFGCKGNIEAGNLILGWTWSDPAGAHIDGYHVFQSSDARGPFTFVMSTSLQVASMGLGAHANNCFEISAISGQQQSPKSTPFCRKAGDVAVVTELAPNHVRTSTKTHDKHGTISNATFFTPHFQVDSQGVVGHEYYSREHTFGDAVANEIWRTAWSFDLSSIKGPMVSARFKYTIDQSYGSLGNNHSCADRLGTGTEFWWKDQDPNLFIDGPFTITPPLIGPTISVDVTSIVAPWTAGQPNYGIVLRNSDENINAFANTVCDSTFTNVVLDVIHY